MKVLLFIPFLVMCSLNEKKQTDTFKILCFKEIKAEYHLHTYDYDSSWINFLHNANLKEADFIIDDKDIKEYNWDNQEIILLKSGIEKLDKFKQANKLLDHVLFIVTLNNKRIYAGKFISFMSAMAIQHPVIHYNITNNNAHINRLRIYPVHTILEYTTISEELKSRTATNEIKEVFKKLNKLKQRPD